MTTALSTRGGGTPLLSLWLLGLVAAQPVAAAGTGGYHGRGAGPGAPKVPLSDVQAITVHAGRYTRGRRAPPVPQLACVGGAAAGKFAPTTVQCRNQGSDGLRLQWACEAELDSRYRFGETTVTCEGYDAADDKYILAGSCGVEYTLEYAEAAKPTRLHRHDDTSTASLIWLGLLGFVLVGGGSDGLLLSMLGFHLFPVVGTFLAVTLAVSWLFESHRRPHRQYWGGAAHGRQAHYDHDPWAKWGVRRFRVAKWGRGYGPGHTSLRRWA